MKKKSFLEIIRTSNSINCWNYFGWWCLFSKLMILQTERCINLHDFSIRLSNRDLLSLWKLLAFCWIVMKSKSTSVFWPKPIFCDKKQFVNFRWNRPSFSICISLHASLLFDKHFQTERQNASEYRTFVLTKHANRSRI